MLPAGATGSKGDTGSQGPAGPANSLSIGTVTSGTAAATITGTAPNQTLNLVLPPGAAGATGPQGPQGPAGTVNLSDETPQPLGAASAGTALSAARADHVHAQGSIAYSGLSGIPSTFAPSAHQHAVSDVTGLQAALDGKQPAGTYATLVGGTVPSSQLPSYVDDVIEYANLAAFTEQSTGKIYVARDTGKIYRWSGSAYVEISPSPGSTDSVTEGSVNLYHTNARAAAAAPVQSVAGRTGTVTLAKADVGLGNVDNTADSAKPISTATQAALDGKAATSHTHSLGSLTQSGATTGQVPQWTGTAWEPGTPSGGGGSYALPTATSSVLGGIKVGSGLTITDGVLAATGGGGGGSDSRFDFFKPLPPASVTAVGGNAQASVSWPAATTVNVLPVTDYVVQYSSNSGSTWTTFSDGTSTATSATVTGLTNGTGYTFRVAGVNAIGQGEYSTASSSVTPIAGDPNWSDVRLLFHADGANNSTSFTNTKGNALTLSARGSAVVSTAQAKFGSGSLYVPSSGTDGLNINNAGSLLVFTGDYTIEFWMYFSSIATDSSVYITHDGGDSYHAINIDSSSYSLYFNNSSPANITHSLQANQWNHVAIVRSGSTVSAYTNGSRVGTVTSGGTHGNASPSSARIASANGASYYIDEFRATAVARYSGASFAVPTAAFPDS